MSPDLILADALAQAQNSAANLYTLPEAEWAKLEQICRCTTNKAPIRFLMACLLAKIHQPAIDIRKPYTEIGGSGCYSGRTYDETYIGDFVIQHQLPCNATTAFLTPAFRTIDRLLTPDLVLVGKPKEVYQYSLEILSIVENDIINPKIMLINIFKILLDIKSEQILRMQQLLQELAANRSSHLSSEQIWTVLNQHLACKNTSRLPVLMVAAAYRAIEGRLQEYAKPLSAHNAADKQTGTLGDVEIENADNQKLTCYEMKDKKVTIHDLDIAIKKLVTSTQKPDNYLFITTDFIDNDVIEYSRSLYDQTGIEFAILDCLGFMRHFLHFFHQDRLKFLDIYQQMVLDEPISAVGQPLKEAFLALRRQAESE